MDVKERGIDLAFQRTYNSQSQHNVANGDGSGIAIFGNGWTNAFDARIVYNAASNTFSLYDIDGARYDWTSNGSGGWIPPAGLQGETFAPIGSCNYDWTKRDGTIYRFANPFASCSTPAGYYGRLTNIFERNGNNSVALYYTWKTNASSLSDIASIQVLHADGQSLTLAFSNFGTNPELSSITRPDGQQVLYSYDSTGNLSEVDRPGTNTISVLPELYGYNGQQLTIYAGPRDSLSYRATGVANDGEYTSVSYSGNNVSGYVDVGTMNFTPSDGTGVPLQQGIPTTAYGWRYVNFSGIGTSAVTMTDSDGHATGYALDSSRRETQRSEWTGSQYLVTSSSWDALNDLIASVDPRGLETDYAYDGSGNLIAKADPLLSSSMGSVRPLSTYTYDSYHNVLTYCDPVNNANAGRTFPNNVCPSGNATESVVYDYSDASEPYGRVSSSTDGMNKTTAYQYSTSAQSGVDAGLVTTVTKPSFSQADGSSLTPTTNYTYDAYGNVISVNNGSGTSTYQYDNLQRLTSGTDADGVTDYDTYNLDGSTQTEQTAYQHQLAASAGSFVGTSYTYDADGNVISESIPAAHGSTMASGTLVPDALRRTASSSISSVNGSTAKVASTTPRPRPSNRWDRFMSFMPKDLSVLAMAKANPGSSAGRAALSGRPIPRPVIFAPNGTCISSCLKTVSSLGVTASRARATVSSQSRMAQSITPGGTAVTHKWYDGADRLVEVQQPQDSNADEYPYPWMTRTLYDLSMNGTVALNQILQSNGSGAPTSTQTSSYAAHGNVFDNQVWIDMGWGNNAAPAPRWVDRTGTAYDVLDRTVSQYDLPRSTSPVATFAYDASGYYGLLTGTSRITGEQSTLSYSSNNALLNITFSGGSVSTPYRTYAYDLDSRTASVSGPLGTLSYQYDADGRTTSSTEPSGQGGNVVSYTYSPNGWRQTLSVTGMINRKLFDYVYRADGKESEEIVHSALGTTGTFNWQYSAAGRVQRRTDPTTGFATQSGNFPYGQTTNGPLTDTYDSYGRRSGVTYPNGMSVSMVADAMDNPSSDVLTAPLMYSVRKELIEANGGGSAFGPVVFSADGHLTAPQQCPPTGSACYADPDSQISETFDLLDGNTLATQTSSGAVVPIATTYNYDAAGRETQKNASGCVQNGGYQGPSGGSSDVKNTVYDAEDHIVTMSEQGVDYDANCVETDFANLNIGVTTGPDGHPALVSEAGTETGGSFTSNIKLHWDGDSLLFTSDDYGVHEVKIRALGDVTEQHGYFYVFDRSQDGGGVVDIHSTVGSNSAPTDCGGGLVGTSPIADCADISEPTDESIMVLAGSVTIQGARAIETATTTFMSPDAVAGSDSDPLSQLPYVFERNNSIAYSDPTGYCSEGHLDDCKEIGRETARPSFIGKAGEAAVSHEIGPKRAIRVDGRLRFPDGLRIGRDISEVKNVVRQALTKQLRDYIKYAGDDDNKIKFRLYVREGTKLTSNLIKAMQGTGNTIIRALPNLGNELQEGLVQGAEAAGSEASAIGESLGPLL